MVKDFFRLVPKVQAGSFGEFSGIIPEITAFAGFDDHKFFTGKTLMH